MYVDASSVQFHVILGVLKNDKMDDPARMSIAQINKLTRFSSTSMALPTALPFMYMKGCSSHSTPSARCVASFAMTILIKMSEGSSSGIAPQSTLGEGVVGEENLIQDNILRV